MEVGGREDGRKRAGRGAEDELAGVLKEKGYADGGDEDVDRGTAAQGAVDDAFDQDAKDRATDHGAGEDEEAAPERALGDEFTEVIADKGADHKNLGVGEIDKAQHAVNHRVAKRDEGVDGTEGEAVEELLEEFGHVGLRAKSGELRAGSRSIAERITKAAQHATDFISVGVDSGEGRFGEEISATGDE